MAVGSSNDFDLVVLGAGTGGYTAAFRAAQLGLKVALVDEDKIGGTCLHRGCIPTKALLESAGFVEHVRHAKDYGLVLGADGTEPGIDYVQMAARKDQVVKRMWTGLKTLIDKNLVTPAGRRNVVGRPILYKTTKEFLLHFGLKNLDELPSLEEFEELAQSALGSPAPDPLVQPLP